MQIDQRLTVQSGAYRPKDIKRDGVQSDNSESKCRSSRKPLSYMRDSDSGQDEQDTQRFRHVPWAKSSTAVPRRIGRAESEIAQLRA